MANNDYVKGECRNCAGHLEFPAEAAGQNVHCPHCGQVTELQRGLVPGHKNVQRKGFRPIWLAAALVILTGVAGVATVVLIGARSRRSAATDTNPVAAASTPAKLVVADLQPDEVLTNDFDISPVKLDKAPDSSLVYVIGKVRNLSNHQRFGVKVEFTLFDTYDRAIGHATDYQSVLESNGVWDFKAMVMESKAVTAHFSTIKEDQ